MSDDPNFLARWSRRKQEAKRAESPAPAGAEAEKVHLIETPAGLATASDAQPPVIAAPAALSDEELAALPRIEDLTTDTDMTPFLRVGVPASLRNAALRRIWATDPAIRDFVGEARDYAYDWNTLGGVPGNGPMLASDDVPAMLQKILGSNEVAASEPLTRPQPEASGGVPHNEAGLAGDPQDAATSPESVDSVRRTNPRIHSDTTDIAEPLSADKRGTSTADAQQRPHEPNGEGFDRAILRRHGGAVPT